MDRFAKAQNYKKLLFTFAGLFMVGVITFVISFSMIMRTTNSEEAEYYAQNGKKQELVANDGINSSVIEKENSNNINNNSVNEVDNTNSNSDLINSNTVTNTINSNTITNTNTNNTKNAEKNKIDSEETVQTSTKPEVVDNPTFILPVEGEVVRGFSIDQLSYSNTLQEWIIHTGLDIEGEKGKIVKASSDGKVMSIKNDPRYGYTIIIEHVNGFKTVYSNLTNTEMIKVDQEVKQGEAIGTIGQTASFELDDAPHIHFEILKDDILVDPNEYLNN